MFGKHVLSEDLLYSQAQNLSICALECFPGVFSSQFPTNLLPTRIHRYFAFGYSVKAVSVSVKAPSVGLAGSLFAAETFCWRTYFCTGVDQRTEHGSFMQHSCSAASGVFAPDTSSMSLWQLYCWWCFGSCWWLFTWRRRCAGSCSMAVLRCSVVINAILYLVVLLWLSPAKLNSLVLWEVWKTWAALKCKSSSQVCHSQSWRDATTSCAVESCSGAQRRATIIPGDKNRTFSSFQCCSWIAHRFNKRPTM